MLTNFEADIFRRVIARAGRMAGLRDEPEMVANVSLRVIADHIRAAAFLIADGVLPGNEDRNYVLRRIVRRALRHGHRLDLHEPFFHRLVAPLAEEMGEAYPLLAERQQSIEAVLLGEEERFARTLDRGMGLLERTIAGLSGDTIAGEVAFELYDTYGFPVDLTADVARERGLHVDMPAFDAVMEAQRARSREASRFRCKRGTAGPRGIQRAVRGLYGPCEPGHGRRALSDRRGRPGGGRPPRSPGIRPRRARPHAVLRRSRRPGRRQRRDRGGGGAFRGAGHHPRRGQHLHRGQVVDGALEVGQEVHATVDAARRGDIVLNHSATHLLHKALRDELGPHVQQKGSLVAPDRLRFDFSHPAPVDEDALRRIEGEVNARIRENTPATTEVMPFAEAMQRGAVALFGEKYGDECAS